MSQETCAKRKSSLNKLKQIKTNKKFSVLQLLDLTKLHGHIETLKDSKTRGYVNTYNFLKC